jgi:hypothetical protein
MADEQPKGAPPAGLRHMLEVQLREGETEGERMAEIVLTPHVRSAFVNHALAVPLFGTNLPTCEDEVAVLQKTTDAVAAKDLRCASDMLVTQAHTLDAIFTDMTHRALMNVGKYPDVFHRYMALALKAQSNSRATIEALARLHQPREQVIRHVHVYEGGQAVVAEEFHHHSGGSQNAGIAHQPHAKGSPRAALPGANAIGETVPISGDQGREALPDARRQRKRSSAGKSKRTQARVEVG